MAARVPAQVLTALLHWRHAGDFMGSVTYCGRRQQTAYALLRIVHYPQMDIEYTIWQMFYLCIAPSKVYVFRAARFAGSRLTSVAGTERHRTTSVRVSRRLLPSTLTLPSMFSLICLFTTRFKACTHLNSITETKNQWARDDPAFTAILVRDERSRSVANAAAI